MMVRSYSVAVDAGEYGDLIRFRDGMSFPAIAEREPVSVLGVTMLSFLAVAVTIATIAAMAGLLLGAWWVVSHIPVPAMAMHALRWMHLA